MAGERHGRGMLCVNPPLAKFVPANWRCELTHISARKVKGSNQQAQDIKTALYQNLVS
jgi:hypothetical protein